MKKERFLWETKPMAQKENTVCGKNYRFTVLTPRLIRAEFSASGVFEDRASQSVFNRDFPKNDFKITNNQGLLIIETEDLTVTYKENAEFSADTLSFKLKNEPASAWRFSEPFEDLGGTAKTLDAINGALPLGKGVCSRNGFSVIDDSTTLLLNTEGWVEPRLKNSIDIYFFGYGYNYLESVKDFYRLTGAPPMLPAYALGNWWSRYHKYTDKEYISLMKRFKEENIPFTVGVVDMDWHITEIPEEQKCDEPAYTTGWTGYTWNTDLFPDYKQFLRDLKELNLKTSLSLHPAAGVCPHEEMYPEMAKALGIDPKTRKRVPFNVLSKNFMEKYFDILHHPYEADGVDFWWMDWQQGTNYDWIHEPNTKDHMADPRESLDPLWMLNHLHILDISRNGKRPMFFSRFSGPGSHRYPVGFSGDTYVTWDSLDFQPYFTATASNIGYGWWSHDIGGHMMGYRDDELTARWVELGAFSPINRLHSTSSEFQRKEPWSYGKDSGEAMKKFLRLRHCMFPYIYTMNYRCNNELVPLVTPMYYYYPKCSAAYEMKNQFFFGSQLMVAPITHKSDSITRLGYADVWFPKGDWFDFFTGAHYKSLNGRKMKVYRALDEYPVFAKSGAIVPMMPLKEHDNSLSPSENPEIVVFPASNGEFTLYEDEGEYDKYKSGAFAQTKMLLQWSENPVLSIEKPIGELALLPKERHWKIHFRGFSKDVSASVTVGGKPALAELEYCNETQTATLCVTAKSNERITVKLSAESLIKEPDPLVKCKEILQLSQLSVTEKENLFDALEKPTENLLWKVRGLEIYSPEEQHLTNALKEQITLLADEFENL